MKFVIFVGNKYWEILILCKRVSSNLKMRKITNSKSISENQDNLGFLINGFLSELKVDSFKNQKKILEVCHVGKFLMFFENNLQIEKLNEEPDFILTDNHTLIATGLVPRRSAANS